MLSQTLQYLFSGLTNGAIYALAALGFSLIYNASGVINFAQGEFIMLGGVCAVMLSSAGVPLPLAILLAVLAVSLVGLLLEKLAIEQTKGFIGTGGIVNMSPTDHMGLDLSAFRMLEIRNGTWTLAK